MTTLLRTGILALVLAFVLTAAPHATAGQDVPFALSPGQSIPVAEYIVQYQGLTANRPSYVIYSATGVPLVTFQADPSGPYVFRNLAIVTTSVTGDGRATGSITVN